MGMVTGGSQAVTITGDVVVAEPLTVDGTVTATPSGTQAVSAATLPLPTGAAAEATLASVLAQLVSLLAELELKANLAETQPVSTASLPLPAGAATAAGQLAAGHAVSGTVTANPATAASKTLTYVPVNQSGAGTTVLAAASPGNRHKIVGGVLVISLLGTLKFTDGSGDLTGPMDIGTNGGFVVPMSTYPFQQTAVNSALNLITTLGAARGVITILTEP